MSKPLKFFSSTTKGYRIGRRNFLIASLSNKTQNNVKKNYRFYEWICDRSSSSRYGYDRNPAYALYILFLLAGVTQLRNDACQTEEFHLDEETNTSEKPLYRRCEIGEHTTKEKGIWVTHGNGVYDITKFVVNHPGGQEKIILAAGGAVEPFWKIYRQHYNSQLALNALKPHLIGYLHPDDFAIESAELESTSSDDPYSNDPQISPVQTFHQKKPINSESPPTLLGDSWVTPKEMWFNRNHHPVPHLNSQDYRLSIGGPGVKGEKVELSLDDLKTKFKKFKVILASKVQIQSECSAPH